MDVQQIMRNMQFLMLWHTANYLTVTHPLFQDGSNQDCKYSKAFARPFHMPLEHRERGAVGKPRIIELDPKARRTPRPNCTVLSL